MILTAAAAVMVVVVVVVAVVVVVVAGAVVFINPKLNNTLTTKLNYFHFAFLRKRIPWVIKYVFKIYIHLHSLHIIDICKISSRG